MAATIHLNNFALVQIWRRGWLQLCWLRGTSLSHDIVPKENGLCCSLIQGRFIEQNDDETLLRKFCVLLHFLAFLTGKLWFCRPEIAMRNYMVWILNMSNGKTKNKQWIQGLNYTQKKLHVASWPIGIFSSPDTSPLELAPHPPAEILPVLQAVAKCSQKRWILIGHIETPNMQCVTWESLDFLSVNLLFLPFVAPQIARSRSLCVILCLSEVIVKIHVHVIPCLHIYLYIMNIIKCYQ